MYALVDCNNFYCSCERVFDPRLNGRPVIVLSNNDGCAIARSEEAKAAGVEMGSPEYMIRDIITAHNIAVFSSNYTLYGDMSDRVMKILASFVPRLELYSIDEAFLDMANMPYVNLAQLGLQIKRTVQQYTGIPVTVGIGPTKTLAKMANRFAKKKRKDTGVHWLANNDLIEQVLKSTEVNDVWGIGQQYAAFLRRHGFKTAYDVAHAPDDWIREHMTVVGHRLLMELNGTPAIAWEFMPPRKKNICTSRSFGSLTTDKSIVIEAVSNYAALCAEKLRKDKSCARDINIFVETNRFRTQDQQYSANITLQAEIATNTTGEIIAYARKGLEIIFKPGLNYNKCGVIVSDLVPEDQVQFGIFESKDHDKNKRLMQTLDRINRAMGTNIVRHATQGFQQRHRLKASFLSKRYTTRIEDVLTVKI